MAFRPPESKSVHTTGSFTIKNILNLPDEPREEPQKNPMTIPERDAPLQNSCVVRPLVPLALRPGVNMSRNMFSASSLQLYPPWSVGPNYLPGWPNDPSGYPCPEFLQGYNPNWRRSRRPLRKKKQRPLFSQQQVQTLESEFQSKKYLTEEKRAGLSQRLKLTETQVKTWFQNRRTKWRKEVKTNEKVTKHTSSVGATCREARAEQDCCTSLHKPHERSSSPKSSPREGIRSPMFFIDLNSSKTSVMEAIRTPSDARTYNH